MNPRFVAPARLGATSTSSIVATLAAVLMLAPPVMAQEPAMPAGCVVLELNGVRPQQGQLMINLFDSAEAFGKKPVASLRVPAGAEAVQRITACGLGAATEIAVMMFQDLDNNGKMARNVLGVPSEPWGSSGSPGVFGPAWDTGRVKLAGTPVAVQISR